MDNVSPHGPSAPQKLISLKQAAATLGIHVWALRRAVNAGRIPVYTPFNSRRLVKLSEVVAFIEASKRGGQ
ncbi:MAG TPA: helix-turn-helix domain-containing protein [Xanthobacteraceae bacterium]|nr:helix-turn-helix domain-containing protein [Xanthobacteraceae bacterium]